MPSIKYIFLLFWNLYGKGKEGFFFFFKDGLKVTYKRRQTLTERPLLLSTEQSHQRGAWIFTWSDRKDLFPGWNSQWIYFVFFFIKVTYILHKEKKFTVQRNKTLSFLYPNAPSVGPFKLLVSAFGDWMEQSNSSVCKVWGQAMLKQREQEESLVLLVKA